MKLNSVRHLKKWLREENLTQKLKKISYLWRRSPETLTFLWERSRMDEMETLQEHIYVWENQLSNIYFLLIKFSRISFMVFHLCTFPLFFQMLIKYFRINVLYEWIALSRQSFRHGPRHCLLLKASCFMTMSPWKVFLLTEAIFLFVSLFKEQLTSISNYFSTFCADQVY